MVLIVNFAKHQLAKFISETYTKKSRYIHFFSAEQCSWQAKNRERIHHCVKATGLNTYTKRGTELLYTYEIFLQNIP